MKNRIRFKRGVLLLIAGIFALFIFAPEKGEERLSEIFNVFGSFSQNFESFEKEDIEVLREKPFEGEEDLVKESRKAKPYEEYMPLDLLGRCGRAVAVLDSSGMPEGERGSIGEYRPSGWHTVTYPGLPGRHLYNRGHLIAFCLGGESTDNMQNLITMTRQCNENMIPYEIETARYLEESPKRKVLYRVSPEFEGEELLARSLRMEILSLDTKRLSHNLRLYNVQEGIEIDYTEGRSRQR